jgi:hypothetical protein
MVWVMVNAISLPTRRFRRNSLEPNEKGYESAREQLSILESGAYLILPRGRAKPRSAQTSNVKNTGDVSREVTCDSLPLFVLLALLRKLLGPDDDSVTGKDG